MSFFGIGTFEFFTILIIALLIFGPGRLPELMGDAGRMLRDFRRYSRELTGDFQDSVRDVRQTYEEIETDMRDTAREFKRDTNEIARSVNETAAEATRLDTDSQPAERRNRRSSTRRQTTTRSRDEVPLDQADISEPAGASEDRVQSESPAPVAPTARQSQRRTRVNETPAAPDDLLSVDDEVDDLLAGTPASDAEGSDVDSDGNPKTSS